MFATRAAKLRLRAAAAAAPPAEQQGAGPQLCGTAPSHAAAPRSAAASESRSRATQAAWRRSAQRTTGCGSQVRQASPAPLQTATRPQTRLCPAARARWSAVPLPHSFQPQPTTHSTRPLATLRLRAAAAAAPPAEQQGAGPQLCGTAFSHAAAPRSAAASGSRSHERLRQSAGVARARAVSNWLRNSSGAQRVEPRLQQRHVRRHDSCPAAPRATWRARASAASTVQPPWLRRRTHSTALPLATLPSS